MTADKAALLELRDRLKAATGPDREIDAAIMSALFDPEREKNYWGWQSSRPKGSPVRPTSEYWQHKAPPLTGSLAVGLVPDRTLGEDGKMSLHINQDDDGSWHVEFRDGYCTSYRATYIGEAETLPLAICDARLEYEIAKVADLSREEEMMLKPSPDEAYRHHGVFVDAPPSDGARWWLDEELRRTGQASPVHGAGNHAELKCYLKWLEERAMALSDENDSLIAESDTLLSVLERAQMILTNMALEQERRGHLRASRWPINHEPLRADAKNLLPEIVAVLAAAKQAREPQSTK